MILPAVLLGLLFVLAACSGDSKDPDADQQIDGNVNPLAGGDYSDMDFSAADPLLYDPIFPQQFSSGPPTQPPTPVILPTAGTTFPSGRFDGASELPGAGGGQDVTVESLQPRDLALGQIVPFELRVDTSSTVPVGDCFTFITGYETVTTPGDAFGFDEEWGMVAAFVDSSDPANTDPNATVNLASWELVGTEIQATVEVCGVSPDSTIVVEMWIVLDEDFPEADSPGGNVQTRLIDAFTSGTVDPNDSISTGNQTVPLLQVGKFTSVDVDLSIDKVDFGDDTGNGESVPQGGVVIYQIEVTNTNDPLGDAPYVANDVVVTDTLDANTTFMSATSTQGTCSEVDGVVTCDIGSLIAGQTETITITVEVSTTAPIDGDGGDPGPCTETSDLCNMVVVTSLTDDPDPTNNSDEEPTDVEVPAAPGISITKTVADPGTYSAVGDVLNFTIVATNIGNVTLDSVTVTDEQVSDLSCTPTNGSSLAPGESMTCTASHTVTQADLDAGSFYNQACVDDGEGGAVEVCDDVEPPAEQNPELSITKTVADPGNYDEVGDVLNFTIVATNIGNVTLDSVTVTDEQVSDLSCTPTNGSSLAPGESMTCTASHTVTQADLDAGSFYNQACVDDGEGGAVEVCDDVEPPAEQNPELSITKTVADPGNYDEVGDVLNFTIVATNIGNVTLDSVTVTDEQVSDLSCTPTNGSSLAPGESMTCTASHTVTQADLDAGSFYNQACVDDGEGGAVEVCDDVEPPAEQNPELSITKTVADPGNYDEVGDVLNFTIVATNIGNVTLDSVTVTDEQVSDLSCTPTNGSPLAPGESMTCTASHTVTQADLDNGSFYNQACVDDGADGAAEVCDDVEPPAQKDEMLTIEKTVADPGTYNAVGDVLNFTIVATNIGNVTLDSVTVTDEQVSDLSCTPTNGSSLAPGESMTCTASHTVTQADLDAGSFYNQACVDDGEGGAVEVCDDVEPPAEQNPELSITKTVADPGNYDEVGDVLNFTIVATNIGNVTLDSVTVTDEQVSDLSCTPTNGSSLAPGESMTCTASHTVTQADLDNGSFYNQACVDDGADGAAEVCDDVEPPAQKDEMLTIEKTVADPGTYSAVGDVLNFTIVATNIGNVTLDSVTVTDEQVSDLSCTPTNGSSLAPGESMTCTASHTVTQADLDAGSFYNQACVDDGEGGAVEVCDDVEPPAEQNPELSITKTVADPGNYDEVGDVLNFTIVATNIGNVTLDSVTVTDEQVSDLSCTPTNGSPLAPGESMTCTASHTVTQADLDNGSFYNQACVDDGADGAAEVCDDVEPPAQKDEMLTIEKTVADPGTYSAVGDVLNFTIVATNIGNVTLDSVTVTDEQVSDLSCTPTNGSSLAPGESMTCTASHTVTQADLDAGSFYNQACVDDGEGGAVEVCDDVEPPAEQNPELSITKTVADPGNYDEVGDVLNFTIVATNIGNVTLDSVTVTDEQVSDLSCTPTNGSSLAPGESMTCTASHTVTQADLDAGSFYNQACVDDGEGGAVEVCDDVEPPAEQNPELSITKTVADPGNYDEVGDVLNFTIVATNIGNVTLDSVTVTDEQVSDLSCTPTNGSPLAPGESMTCTASHTVTQADLDNGSFYNQACVDDGADGAAEVCDDVEPPAEINPNHKLAKAFATPTVQVDTASSFTITYDNTGNETLTDVMIMDEVDEKLEVTNAEYVVEDSNGMETGFGTCFVNGTNPQDLLCDIGEVESDEIVIVTVEFIARAIFNVLNPDPNQRKGVEYIIVFENGCVLKGDTDPESHVLTCDLNGDGVIDPNTETFDDVGESSQGGQEVTFNPPDELFGPDDPDFTLHLSCSEPFIDGFAQNGGPTPGENPNWKISEVEIDRYHPNQGLFKECGQVFLPIDVPNTATATAVSPSGGLLESPISSEEVVVTINPAP